MNVVCVLLDTLRRDYLGCYGNEWIDTPNLDRMAAHGARFDQAYIGSYPCMPARQDLWTGQLNFLRRGWSPLEPDQIDLVTQLRRAGKTTMLVTDHYHLWQVGSGNYHYSFHGAEFIRGQEQDNWKTSAPEIRWPARPDMLNKNWEKYARNTADFCEEEHYFAAKVFNKSMEWVEENQHLDDFFLMIDCFDPHEPFDPPPGYAERYMERFEGQSVIWPTYGPADRFSEDELRRIQALYAGEVSYVDHWFGKLYDKLDQTGLLERTMVIVTSDHGFLFGEHNWLGKHARILFQDIARTPLLIHHPVIPSGSVYNQLVQMPDLTPTILQTLGALVPDSVQGASLLPLWEEGQEEGQQLGKVGASNPNILEREAIVFGSFGGPLYVTDGDWLLVKKPAPGNVPLYWYTRTHYANWEFGQITLPEDTAERRSQWDGERFPTQYAHANPGHAGPRLIDPTLEPRSDRLDPEDELYHVAIDPGQTNNVHAELPKQVQRMELLMSDCMNVLDAPVEQWNRLALP